MKKKVLQPQLKSPIARLKTGTPSTNSNSGVEAAQYGGGVEASYVHCRAS